MPPVSIRASEKDSVPMLAPMLAHVEMASAEDAEAARQALNDSDLKGARLQVNPVPPPKIELSPVEPPEPW